jgi:hypothetical protein
MWFGAGAGAANTELSSPAAARKEVPVLMVESCKDEESQKLFASKSSKNHLIYQSSTSNTPRTPGYTCGGKVVERSS